jgi:thiamine biosynthesis protein ThiI
MPTPSGSVAVAATGAPPAGGPGARRIIIRFGEIALKKGNRRWFMARLRQNMERALAGLPVSGVSVRPNRGFVTLHDPGAWEHVRERLSRVPGITSFSLALQIEPTIEAMKAAWEALAPDEPPRSFRVRARRADKRFPVRSVEIEREVGRYIQDRTGAAVDLTNGDLTYGIEVQREGVFVFVGQESGPGGLPVGTAGRVAVLLSGGIDSPVAAYRMQRRGCDLELVHFTSYPFTDRASWDKSRALARILARYQFEVRLHAVPLGQVQQQIIVATQPRYRVLLYRRMMFRIAEEIARRTRCQALVTGESIGQVGSQTLANLTSIERAVEMPVLRPLISFDKLDITREAEALGTYPISIEPDMDCCQYLVPPKVATESTPGELDGIEEPLDIQALVRTALAEAEVEEFRWPDAQPSP